MRRAPLRRVVAAISHDRLLRACGHTEAEYPGHGRGLEDAVAYFAAPGSELETWHATAIDLPLKTLRAHALGVLASRVGEDQARELWASASRGPV